MDQRLLYVNLYDLIPYIDYIVASALVFLRIVGEGAAAG